MRGIVAVGVVCAAVALSGCGTDTVEGQAGAEETVAGESAFVPCDDIPDEVIHELGLDPTTESRDILGVAQPGWSICMWDGERYGTGVGSTTHTLADLRANAEFEDFFDIDVAGRVGLGYREVADTRRESCDVAVESSGGVVLVSVGLNTVTPPPDPQEACEIALDSIRVLDPFIPG